MSSTNETNNFTTQASSSANNNNRPETITDIVNSPHLPYEPEEGVEDRNSYLCLTSQLYEDRRTIYRCKTLEHNSYGFLNDGKDMIWIRNDIWTPRRLTRVFGRYKIAAVCKYQDFPGQTKKCYDVDNEYNNKTLYGYKFFFSHFSAPAPNLKAVLLNLVPKCYVDEKHVHGCKQVLYNNDHLCMFREDFYEVVPGQVRVDGNGVVSYSEEYHTLTNPEVEVLMKQLIEGHQHIYSVDPLGNVNIHNFVIANGRLKFILGMTTPDNLNVEDRAEIERLLGMPGAFFAATGVTTKRFEGNRFKLPEEIDNEFYLPLDKHFRVCVLFLLELFTGGLTIFDEPTFNDERYKLLIHYCLLSRNPIAGWENAVRNSEIQSVRDNMESVIHRVREISPQVLHIFEGVLGSRPAWCRMTLGFAHWFLQEGYRVLSPDQWEEAAAEDACQRRGSLFEPIPLGEEDSNIQIDNIDQEFVERMME